MSNNVATLLGPQVPMRIDWRGKTYNLAFLNQRVKADISNWILQQKVKVLEQFKPLLSPEKYQERVGRLMDEWDEGKYGFLSPDWIRQIQSSEGVVQLAIAMFRSGGSEISEDDLLALMLEKGDEFKLIFDGIVSQSMPPKE